MIARRSPRVSPTPCGGSTAPSRPSYWRKARSLRSAIRAGCVRSASAASATPAAIGFSRASNIPFSEGLIKNRYVGRTFIQPDQGLREQGIKLKFNPLAEVRGKRVVAVDDSIVRGNTTRQIVQMLFEV